jgi:hypothetical protein
MLIRINGTSNKGVVKKINFDHKTVTWHKGKPLFIEIELNSGERMLCGTHQITGKRAK